MQLMKGSIIVSEITRGRYREYGTAVRMPRKGKYFLAWAVLGETKADGPLNEDGKVHFQFGKDAEEALFLLKADLDESFS
jgi:hypothetical protein